MLYEIFNKRIGLLMPKYLKATAVSTYEGRYLIGIRCSKDAN